MTDNQINYYSLIVQIIGTLGVFSVFLQIRSNSKWNRIKNTLENKWEEEHKRLSSEIEKIEQKGLMDCRNAPLTDEQYEVIKKDKEAYSILCEMVNLFDALALAYYRKAIDRRMAYSLYSNDLIKAFPFYKTLIEKERIEDDDVLEFNEFERLYKKWNTKCLREKRRIAFLRKIGKSIYEKWGK